MEKFFHPTSLAGRAALALFYGVCLFVVIYIIGIILGKFPEAVEVGAFLKQWAALIGLLGGLVVFFTGARPTA